MDAIRHAPADAQPLALVRAAQIAGKLTALAERGAIKPRPLVKRMPKSDARGDPPHKEHPVSLPRA